MATAERAPRARRWWWLVPAALVLGAIGIGVARQASSGSTDRPASPEVVRVDATSATAYPSLESLTAASDVVIRGEVVATSRGRLVGDGTSAVVSRVLTVHIDDVLGGDPPSAATVLVEEEGWLADGRALAVNGVAPTEPGDRGIWFLVALDDPELPGYVTVGTQGRFLARDGVLEGGDPTDPVVAAAVALGEDALSAAVRSAGARATGGSIAP